MTMATPAPAIPRAAPTAARRCQACGFALEPAETVTCCDCDARYTPAPPAAAAFPGICTNAN